MDKKKLIGAGVAIALVAGAIGAGVAKTYFPTEKVVEKEVIVTETKEVVKEVPKEVVKEVVVEKEVLVPVDNGNLNKSIEFIQDNLDEDIDMDYILFEVDSKLEAEQYIREELISLLDDEEAFDGGFLDQYRKSEVSIVKIYEPELSSIDYEDKDLTLTYEVKLKAKEDGEDRVYYTLQVVIPYEDGKLVEDDIELVLP